MAGEDWLGDVPKDGWQATHSWKMPEWVEPIIIILILFPSMYLTRRRNYSVFRRDKDHTYKLLDEVEAGSPSPRSSNEFELLPKPDAFPPKTRSLCGFMRIRTPNSSRFARNVHSRILQKFPFLVEMFYWAIALALYRGTGAVAQLIYGGHREMWDSAADHGLALLDAEAYFFGNGHEGPKRWLEWRIQRWFLHGSEAGDYRVWFLTILNRGYALIHIPGTVGFISYYYATAPTHRRFCTVRRTLTLTNMLAFVSFILIPTCPPRLLDEKYGFVDTVNLESAESVWMSGKFVNKLAAFPSMHFGYAFCIGCVFIADSGVLTGLINKAFNYVFRSSDPDADAEEEDDEDLLLKRRSPLVRGLMFAFGLWYPCWILLTIVGTANHYFLDALAAVFTVMVAYVFNRFLLVFLPLEDYLLWACRMDKPIPTTGRMKNLVVE
ncbi:uncharacterized protein J7T54_006922 [Emericellopsis cladophorae]|uniref:Inositolphosphotransferase Aur1/Ipt1 domain-containing protein n=1 Tax=Emericellopsis cladophorae TaxID=2686198 RepID=A0A9P9Y959_9HYPO|nr:uncharacterized protein J7T54_006922 [Emericellopsis cladophorae]KAI6785280.1 hypothetical protein J7T54_006922 [Emericellopsis cladophorae]